MKLAHLFNFESFLYLLKKPWTFRLLGSIFFLSYFMSDRSLRRKLDGFEMTPPIPLLEISTDIFE